MPGGGFILGVRGGGDEVCISLESLEACALYGTVCKQMLKFFSGHFSQLCKCKREKVVLRVKFCHGGVACRSIVRAALLACIASVDSIAYHLLYPLRQVASHLNGETREAFAGIYCGILCECMGGACVQACSALAAAQCAWAVGRQFQCGYDCSQKEV